MSKNLLEHGTWDTLVPFVKATSRATCHLPFAALLPGERQMLGGFLFPNAGYLVELVGEALERQGALFPDLPVDGAELRQTQGAAFVWATLRNHFQLLAQRAADTYVKVQSLAVQRAIMVVEHMRTLATLPASQETNRPWHEQRLDALAPALLMLSAYRQSLLKIKRKKKEAREKARAAPAAGSRRPAPADTADPRLLLSGDGRPALTEAPRPPEMVASMSGPQPAAAEAPASGRRAPSPQKKRAMRDRKARARAQCLHEFLAFVRSADPGEGQGPAS